jgi:GAF domain-containing protein
MVIPITLEEQVVGVLDVQSERVGGLDEGDVDILRTLANQVAVAIRNARLFEQAEQSLNEARAAQEQYMARAWHRFGAQSYTGKIQQPGTVELAEAIKARLGEAAQQQTEPAIMTGSTTDLPKAESQDYTAIVAPIKLQNQVIGNMYFHQLNPSSVHIWSEQELALVQAIADQVAQTAENLRLFDEIRDRAARERTIREITDKLRAASSLEGLVKTAAEELGQRFSAELALVEFGTE